MQDSEFRRLKNKILDIDSTKYWGDDFDVRFLLISNLKKIKNKIVLDVGGGIGIISSEINSENLMVNLDFSLTDLRKCQKNYLQIQNVCASMTDLPFKENSLDVVIGSHIMEEAKQKDLRDKVNMDKKYSKYPSVDKTLAEISRVLKNKQILFLTAANNEYYKTTKINYEELKDSLKNYFEKYELYFYNTCPRLNKKNRKMNLANVLPKLLSKILTREKILNLLLKKDQGTNKMSVSFYVEATKG